MTPQPARARRIEELRNMTRKELTAAWRRTCPAAAAAGWTVPGEAAGWDAETLAGAITDKLIGDIIAAEFTGGLKPSEITGPYYVFAEAPDKSRVRGFTGKWLVFVPAAQIDDWWETVSAATIRGDLGWRSKAATARENSLQREANRKVICVYTRDWRDKADVRRVLAGLRALGVGWRLSYKTDTTTRSGQYGDGTAVYVSPPGSADFDDRT